MLRPPSIAIVEFCVNLSTAFQQCDRLISGNDMKPLHRRIIAGVLVVIFFAITLSPLANLSTGFAFIAHTATGKCTGDCDTCGCSPERRASHTCCCQTRLKHHNKPNGQATGCCKKRDNGRTPAISQACSCGRSKHFTLWEKEEVPIPASHFNESIILYCGNNFSHEASGRLVSRDIKPPVPPPELSILL